MQAITYLPNILDKTCQGCKYLINVKDKTYCRFELCIHTSEGQREARWNGGYQDANLPGQ